MHVCVQKQTEIAQAMRIATTWFIFLTPAAHGVIRQVISPQQQKKTKVE
jgi:hypothetical protein